jgi:hypothetical protein
MKKFKKIKKTYNKIVIKKTKRASVYYFFNWKPIGYIVFLLFFQNF